MPVETFVLLAVEPRRRSEVDLRSELDDARSEQRDPSTVVTSCQRTPNVFTVPSTALALNRLNTAICGWKRTVEPMVNVRDTRKSNCWFHPSLKWLLFSSSGMERVAVAPPDRGRPSVAATWALPTT
jgi:hypothetical protein